MLEPYLSFFHFFNLTVFNAMYHLVINVILKNKYEFGLGYGCSASVRPGNLDPGLIEKDQPGSVPL